MTLTTRGRVLGAAAVALAVCAVSALSTPEAPAHHVGTPAPAQIAVSSPDAPAATSAPPTAARPAPTHPVEAAGAPADRIEIRPSATPRSTAALPRPASSAPQTSTPAAPPATSCAAAIAYLSAHAAPGFAIECPGATNNGAQAMTCQYDATWCPGRRVIAIRVPCPIAYENEAANSWAFYNWRPGDAAPRIDPFGGSC